MVVAEFVTPSHQWDVHKLRQFLCEEDVEVISSLPISRQAPDSWIWHYDKKGKYTVKSGYKFSMLYGQESPSSLFQIEEKWWKKLWKLRIPNKIKHFVWCSFHNSIPTMANLWRHHVPVQGLCVLCQASSETTEHALFHCKRAKHVWEALVPINLWNHQ